MARNAFCSAMRRRSGRVSSSDPLAFVLYFVLRDHMPSGTFEELLEDAFKATPRKPHRFTNGWTARHALDAARRLRRRAR